MIQLTTKQVSPGCWYNDKEYAPPDDMKVIVSDGNEWAAAYTIGGGTSWCWHMKPDFEGPLAWCLPALPRVTILVCKL